jgi:AcrR family transcriptional regulator
VTIADIAAAAEIAPRTYFSYFPTKEDVVFHDHDEVLAGLSARIAARADHETTLDAMRAWLADMLEGYAFDDPIDRQRKALVRATPALQTRELAKTSAFERVLREGVATDFGDGHDDLRPRIVAAAATAALMSLDEIEDRLLAERRPMDVIDETMSFLKAGMGALSSG